MLLSFSLFFFYQYSWKKWCSFSFTSKSFLKKNNATFFSFRYSTCDWPVILAVSYISMNRSMIFSTGFVLHSVWFFFSSLFLTNLALLSTFQFVAMHLNNVSIHVFTFPPTPPPLPSCNVTRLRELLYNDIQCAGLFPRKETGHLLFSHSDMKRHFYFCRPPLSRTASLVAIPFLFKTLAGISMPTYIRERGLRWGFEATYNMDIALVPSKNFLSFRHRRPSNFSYSFSNRLARELYSRISLPGCFCAILSHRAILMCLSTSCFRFYIPEVARIETRVSRSIFNSRIVHYFLQ